jgi:3-dehydrosphinganine reductase
MDFRGQHVIITGGSSGIGQAAARLLTQRGAHVSIIARRQMPLDETLSALETLRQSTDQRLCAVSADVSDWGQVQEAIAGLTSNGYPPDYLLNIAGYCHPGYFEELPVDAFRDTMDVDFFGTLYPTKAVVPAMIARRSGHIVNCSSVAGYYGFYGFTAYCAAKFAITGYSEALRQELKLYGIRVSVLFPPTTDTPGLVRENELKPFETQCLEGQIKPQTADWVAQVLVRGIERRRRFILPGLDTRFFFLLAHLPPALTGVFQWFFIDRVISKARRTRDVQPKEAS